MCAERVVAVLLVPKFTTPFAAHQAGGQKKVTHFVWGCVQVSEKIGGGVVVRELSQLCSHALASMMVSLSSLYYCLAVLSLCRYTASLGHHRFLR